MLMRFLIPRFNIFFICVVCVCSCADDNNPYLIYESEFGTEKISKVENVIKDLAQRRNLRVFEKNRENMKYLSRGEDAFFIALYFKNDPILVVTNVGVGKLITLSVSDYGKMPRKELELLTLELVSILKNEVNISFEKVNRKGNRREQNNN